MKTTNGINKTKKTMKETSSTYMKGKAKKGKKGRPSALESNAAKGRTMSNDSDVEESDCQPKKQRTSKDERASGAKSFDENAYALESSSSESSDDGDEDDIDYRLTRRKRRRAPVVPIKNSPDEPRSIVAKWSEEEKEIYVAQVKIVGQNFTEINKHLPQKTVS